MIEVFLPKEIYEEKVVRRGAADYKAICSCEVIVSSDGTTCKLYGSDESLALTALEFSNYLIELSNARGGI